jgi:hypothetical protein
MHPKPRICAAFLPIFALRVWSYLQKFSEKPAAPARQPFPGRGFRSRALLADCRRDQQMLLK